MPNFCAICNRYADTTALCEKHEPAFHVKECYLFGQFAGFGIYSKKYEAGKIPLHIMHTENGAYMYFDQNRLTLSRRVEEFRKAKEVATV